MTTDPTARASRKAGACVTAAQPKRRTIDWSIQEPAEVLRRVDQSLAELKSEDQNQERPKTNQPTED